MFKIRQNDGVLDLDITLSSLAKTRFRRHNYMFDKYKDKMRKYADIVYHNPNSVFHSVRAVPPPRAPHRLAGKRPLMDIER